MTLVRFGILFHSLIGKSPSHRFTDALFPVQKRSAARRSREGDELWFGRVSTRINIPRMVHADGSMVRRIIDFPFVLFVTNDATGKPILRGRYKRWDRRYCRIGGGGRRGEEEGEGAAGGGSVCAKLISGQARAKTRNVCVANKVKQN